MRPALGWKSLLALHVVGVSGAPDGLTAEFQERKAVVSLAVVLACLAVLVLDVAYRIYKDRHPATRP
jgi:hypothetical protein